MLKEAPQCKTETVPAEIKNAHPWKNCPSQIKQEPMKKSENSKKSRRKPKQQTKPRKPPPKIARQFRAKKGDNFSKK